MVHPTSTTNQVDLSLRPAPHAVGPEKSVLSGLLQDSRACFPMARAAGLTEASFYLPAHARMFSELSRMHDAGNEIELISLIQQLLDRGALDAVGGPAGVTELYTYAPSASYFERHAALLRDKEVQRGMLRLFQESVEAIYDEPEGTEGHLARATERLRELSTVRSVANGSLRERAYALCYDPDSPPPGEEVCLCLGDVPVAARGNITVLQGKSKVGKSAAVSAILGAAMGVSAPKLGDCLSFQWLHGGEAVPGAILHLDTEQSPADWHALVTRSVYRAGLTVPPARVRSLPVVSFSRSERLTLLRESLEYERQHGAGTELVVLDGIADLCVSPNDEAEGLELVSRIMALSHEYRVAIICIIHENPSTDTAKTRGHLGSELNRKAFANLRIDKDSSTGMSVIYGTDMRKREIPQSHGFCFAWDDGANMHTYQGRNAHMKAAAAEERRADLLREKIESIFLKKGTPESCPSLTIKEATEIEKDMRGTRKPVSVEAMKKRFQRAEIHGVLRKTQRGTYLLMPKRQKDTTGTR